MCIEVCAITSFAIIMPNCRNLHRTKLYRIQTRLSEKRIVDKRLFVSTFTMVGENKDKSRNRSTYNVAGIS